MIVRRMTRVRAAVALCLGLALIPTAARGQDGPGTADTDPEAAFSRANQAYEAGNFSDAAQRYEALLGAGYTGGWVHYNLGNAYWRMGQLGRAIAAFRRSEHALPRDGDVRANLAYARRATQDAMAPVEPAPLWRTLFFWHFGLNIRELAWMTLVVNLVFWSALAGRVLRPDSEAARWLTGLTAFLLLIVGGSLLWRTIWPATVAVVSQPEIAVHSGTHRDTVVRFRLHEGTEAQVLDTEGDWIRVELSDGKQGWVAKRDVELI